MIKLIHPGTCTTTELTPRRNVIQGLHRGFQSICNAVDGIDEVEGVYRGSESVRNDLQYLVRSLSMENAQMDRRGLMLNEILINLRFTAIGSRDVEIVETDLGDDGSSVTDIIESYISRNCSRTCSVKSVSRTCSVRSRSVASDGDREDDVVFLDRNQSLLNSINSHI